ncbi:ATP-dependent DNA helicase [Trichonephila clavipes]|nr:ATP-dependent DNA helicase [Trichonephila clavipes]
MIDLLVKGKIFGCVRCFTYSVEWQKHGLPHAHVLTWLETKIRAEQIDDVIRAELPDQEVDPELFDVVKTYMVHSPCGSYNPRSPCMKNGICSKRFPKPFSTETVTGECGYPFYRRRSPENSDIRTTIQSRANCIDIDNRWIVTFSPVLLRTFREHINAELCSSIKSKNIFAKLGNKFKDHFMEDYVRDFQRHYPVADINAQLENFSNRVLFALQDVLLSIGGHTLPHYGLPSPQAIEGIVENLNREYFEHTNFDPVELQHMINQNEPRLNKEQNQVCRLLTDSVNANAGEKKIVIAVPSSGIAATLLHGEKTAHSMFKIPLESECMENPVCSVTKNSDKAKVLQDCVFVVWEECTMANKISIEAVNRTMQDLRGNTLLFGGATFLFAGDFRQTLPVVTKGTRAEEINACLKRSVL